MPYALFCMKCKLGSFCNGKIDPFICDECRNDQADRLNPEDIYYRNEDGTYPPLKACINICDSQNIANK